MGRDTELPSQTRKGSHDLWSSQVRPMLILTSIWLTVIPHSHRLESQLNATATVLHVDAQFMFVTLYSSPTSHH
jgi:hypothetical protein